MTYVLWTVAVALGIVFVALLLTSLVLVRLNDTLLDPRYYPDQFERHGLYRFVMVDVLTSALDETREVEPEFLDAGFRQNPLVTSGLSTRQIADAVHRALSPRDLERLVAPAVLQIAEYATGQRDRVVLKVDAAGPIVGAAYEIHKLMQDSDAYAPFIEYELEPRVREAAGEALGASDNVSGWMLYLFGTAEDAEDRMVRVAVRALTAEWLAVQIEQALDEFTAYLVGESDSFEVRIQLTDAQVTTAVEETKAILREADAYDLVFPGVVEPVLEDVLGPQIELPYGVSIARDEVIDALGQGAPPSWVQLQAERLIDYVGPYMAGRSDGFSTEITLTRNKEEASIALTGVAVAGIRETLMDLPVCGTRVEATDARRRLGRMLPDCIPPGVSDSEIIEQAEAAIVNSVQALVFAPVPDTITFTESHLRSTLERSGGPETLEYLDRLRAILNKGWSYSEDDLRADLSERGDALQALDGVRSFLGDGYSHTYEASSGRRSNDPVGAPLDRAHARLEMVNRYEWPAYLSALVLLVVIGLLGGTTWRSRVLWASSTVLISAGLVYMLSWPMQEPLANAAAEQARAEVRVRADGVFGGSVQLVVAKVGEVAEGVAEDIVGSVRRDSLVLAVAAAVVLMVGVFWDLVVGAVERVQGQGSRIYISVR